MAIDFDLFGNPLPPRDRGRGRPRHVPTEAQRGLARAMRADGAGQQAIALALGITLPTLRLAYPAEIETRSAAAARRAETDQLRRTKKQ